MFILFDISVLCTLKLDSNVKCYKYFGTLSLKKVQSTDEFVEIS